MSHSNILKSSPRVFSYVYSEPDSSKKTKFIPPIIQLSSKLRASIWLHCGYKDKKNLRLVCKNFRADIDTKIGLSINLDERKFHTLGFNISDTIPPSASKLRIWGAELTHSYVNRILLNSQVVTSILFSGPIDIDNFNKILTRCPNLVSVTVTDRGVFEGRFKIPIKLRNVTYLHLGAEGNFQDYAPSSQYILENTSLSRTYQDILTNVTFPCLKHLNIEYIHENNISESPSFDEISNIIFKFLALHKSIAELTLRLHKKRDPEANVSPYHGETKDKVECKIELPMEQIKNIKFKKLIVDTDENTYLFWDVILPQQDSLEYFDCLNQTKSWNYFVPILKKNVKTLKTVKIRNLHPGTSQSTRVDLDVFESCKQLKELYLSRFANSAQEVCFRMTTNQEQFPFLDRISPKVPELVKFKALPSSLVKLHVQGFTVRTEDLMLIPTKAKELEMLELQLLGYRGSWTDCVGVEGFAFPKDFSSYGFGVIPIALKEFVTKLRKLDTLFIEEFLNDRTTLLNDSKLERAVKEVSIIPGDCILKSQGYYGILIDAKEPLDNLEFSRDDRVDLWDRRFNQYRYQSWIQEKVDEKLQNKTHL